MRTVVLEKEEKHDVLRDINEYLHPATPRWYASRGIPLRRGYLFHGPPGTGKTSFSFALAGVFGIDIYVISLQDPTIGEEDLAVLFTRLPRRCIVLLEDIDTAGLRRPDDDGDGDDDEEKKSEKDTEAKSDEKTKKAKKAKKAKDDTTDSDSSSSEEDRKRRKKNKKKKGSKNKESTTSRTTNNILSMETISLSGLLNAIDGVASHEGRILIMTTNKPESLDEALIRPGRVDVQVGFKNATSVQSTELFYRMYEISRPNTVLPLKEQTFSKSTVTTTTKVQNGSILGPADIKNTEEDLPPEELKKISEEFGRLIPEAMFSPAEIQGFLLKRKKSPRKALEDAAGWIEATVKQKEAKSKVATVQ